MIIDWQYWPINQSRLALAFGTVIFGRILAKYLIILELSSGYSLSNFLITIIHSAETWSFFDVIFDNNNLKNISVKTGNFLVIEEIA
jgi:hypothetical protein